MAEVNKFLDGVKIIDKKEAQTLYSNVDLLKTLLRNLMDSLDRNEQQAILIRSLEIDLNTQEERFKARLIEKELAIEQIHEGYRSLEKERLIQECRRIKQRKRPTSRRKK